MTKITVSVNFDELDAELYAVRAGIRAAESHGFLCGFFCLSNSAAPELWQDHLLAGIEDAENMEACLKVLTTLAVQVSEEILDDEIALTLLLPDDDMPIADRTGALAEWCAGFVSGLGLGGIGEQSTVNSECDEFIKDMVALSRMEVTLDESEAAEADLVEIIEYIRVGVIMLHQEWYQLSNFNEHPEILH